MSDHATELDKLKEAARLIEVMTGNRFKTAGNNIFLYSETEQFIAVNMRKDAAPAGENYSIQFFAELMEAGKPINPEQLLQLIYESGVAYALTKRLADMEYHPTPQDMENFNDYILQREEEIQSEGFGMNQQM